MSDKASLVKLEADAARIAKRKQQIVQLQTVQSQAEQEHAANVEKFVLEVAKSTGVTALPPAAILAGLTALAKSTSKVDDDRHEYDGVPVVPVAPARGSQAVAGATEGTFVIVKVSRNVGPKKRDALDRAGLTWNGRAGHWRGLADAVTERELRAVFADRVEFGSQPQPTVDEKPPLDGRPAAAVPEGENLAAVPGTSDPTVVPRDEPASDKLSSEDAAGRVGVVQDAAEQGPAAWPQPLPQVQPAQQRLGRPAGVSYRPD